MMTSSRLRDTGESFSNRRGHASQLSISDPSHHVTEAIGTLYGDSDDDSGHDSRRDSRPLSFIASPYGGEQLQKPISYQIQHQLPTLEVPNVTDGRQPILRTMSDITPSADNSVLSVNNGGLKKSQTLPISKPTEKGSPPFESFLPTLQPASPLSPTLSLRDVQNDSQSASQFPLTNIDNPNDIAQELSNLQALRRMSMDVGNSADPDLIPFQGLSLMAMPSIAPSGEDDEGDISRLLWVPAKVHPELAPDQFRNFLEKRVQSIKRRSGDSLLSTDSQQPRGEGGGLGRKKSMLSRQVENRNTDVKPGSSDGHNEGFTGDWHLQRKTSQASTIHSASELNLNEFVNDPSMIVQRLAMDTQRQTDGSERSSLDDDKPILPVASMGLRRSTRTTYRKGGSLRSGDRVPFSRRSAGARQTRRDADSDIAGSAGPPPPSGVDLSATLESQHATSELLPPENFSRPVRPAMRRHQLLTKDDNGLVDSLSELSSATNGPDVPPSNMSVSSDSAHRELAPGSNFEEMSNAPLEPQPALLEQASRQETQVFPNRSSSQGNMNQGIVQVATMTDGPQPQPNNNLQQHQSQSQQSWQQSSSKTTKRPSFGRSTHPTSQTPSPSPSVSDAGSSQSLSGIAHHLSIHPGSGSTRTDSLTFIPTLSADDRKADKKTRDKEESESGKSMGWKWFKSDEREKKKKGKDKDKEKDREKEEQPRKPRLKPERPQPEKAHDGARLDVLQSSIDNPGPKGRESLLLERDSANGKSHEEKKIDTGGRKAGETKKEKDGFFGSIFGGSRRKESKDGGSNKGKQRVASPEPILRLLRPDVDYPYTRFPIVEERAIYRMAHIKLANPRRDLRSQVLLSNFMYSYLAKVQAMHPQLNVPTSPHQKRQEEERKRREQEQQQQQQQYLEQQMLMQQEQQSQDSVDQYNFDYHRADGQYKDSDQHINDDGSVNYIDDAQIFEYDHGGSHADTASVGALSKEHLQQQQQHRHSQESGQDYGVDAVDSNGRSYYDYGHTENGQHGERDVW